MHFIGKEIHFYNPVIKNVVNKILNFDFNVRTVISQLCQLLDISRLLNRGVCISKIYQLTVMGSKASFVNTMVTWLQVIKCSFL